MVGPPSGRGPGEQACASPQSAVELLGILGFRSAVSIYLLDDSDLSSGPEVTPSHSNVAMVLNHFLSFVAKVTCKIMTPVRNGHCLGASDTHRSGFQTFSPLT